MNTDLCVCASDDALYEYVLDWMAFGIQKPSERCEMAIVMRGGQGTGKGTMATVYGSLFGDHFVHAKKKEDWLAKFNSNLEMCKVLFVDESTFGGNKEDAGLIKTLITESTVTVERKFEHKKNVQNYMNILIASNNDWPVPADVGDRRFVCISPSEKFKGNHAFFENMRKVMFENGGTRGLLDFLQKRDITAFNPRTLPNSETMHKERVSLQVETFDAAQSYAYHLIQSNAIPQDPVGLDYLYDEFRRTVRDIKDVRGITSQILSKKLKECFGDALNKRKTQGRNVWVFKTPDECALAFANFLRCDVSLIRDEQVDDLSTM